MNKTHTQTNSTTNTSQLVFYHVNMYIKGINIYILDISTQQARSVKGRGERIPIIAPLLQVVWLTVMLSIHKPKFCQLLLHGYQSCYVPLSHRQQGWPYVPQAARLALCATGRRLAFGYFAGIQFAGIMLESKVKF